MVSVVDWTLNLSAVVMVAVVLATKVRADWVRIFAIIYGVFVVAMIFVPYGGQINVSVALGLLAYVVLHTLSTTAPLPNTTISQQERVPVFTGVMNAKSNIGRVYNTFDPSSLTYRRLPQSVNRMGGAQFSYTVWVSFSRGINDADVAGKTLFMRGDNKHFRPLYNSKSGTTENYFAENEGKDYTIACPRVSFLGANKLAVDVNTDSELRRRFVIGSDAPEGAMQKNVLSLIPGHFVMYTFVFEDNVGMDAFERGIRMRFYINDQMYFTSTAPGALRQNEGPLYLLLDRTPDGREGVDALSIADLTYYNYALRDTDVASLYSKGYNAEAFKDTSVVKKDNMSLNMSSYNRLDYRANYDDRLDAQTYKTVTI
jgi:hypothetical protein